MDDDLNGSLAVRLDKKTSTDQEGFPASSSYAAAGADNYCDTQLSSHLQCTKVRQVIYIFTVLRRSSHICSSGPI